MLSHLIVLFGGIYVGLRLNKQGTTINTKWVAFKKWLRNLVRDKVK